MSTIPREIAVALGAEPTEEQWRAISMPLEPYVVVAGAGSGKTSVIAARIVYLALVATGRVDGVAPSEGVLPGNVLCLTFTNKATENLMHRVRRALRTLELPEGEEPEVLNYHGFAAQVLDRYGLLAGVEPGQRVLTPAQRTELCARVLDRIAFEHVTAEWQPSVVSKILELASQAADHCVALDDVVRFNEERLEELAQYRSETPYQSAQERIELARAAQLFHDLKRERGVIDFPDQISLALRVVEEHPHVGEDYRRRFATVVLDEYQDTNVAQGRLIAGTFGAGFPVTAVGDPDQNIYAWRGASLYNLLQFPTQFPRADGRPAEKLPLYMNFRSGRRILAAADVLIAPLPSEQRPDPEKRLVAWERGGEGEVEVVRFADEWAEAAGVADRVVALHEAGEPWSSCAVLCRTSRLFYSLQELFRERGVPVEIVGLSGLLALPEIVEILAYARAVADPYASVALARIMLGPRYRVGFKDLARVAAWAKERNRPDRTTEEGDALPFLFAEALEHLDEVTGMSDEGRARVEEFRVELASLREQARRPVGDFLAEVVRRIGLLDELDAMPDQAAAAARRRNVAAFLDEVDAFAPVEGELTLRAFLDYVEAVEASDKSEWAPVQPSEEDSVKVMTIHQAKGLEFDNVFVPGLAKGLLPNDQIQQNPAERGKSLDFELRGDAAILPRFEGVLSRFKDALREQEVIEERRTCYVALTRARRRLVVSGAHWYGETQNARAPSVFFEELAAWAEESGEARVDRGPEPTEDNPLMGYRERLVRDWPGEALPSALADPVFAEGWRRATERAAAAHSVAAAGLVRGLDAAGREAFEHEAARARRVAAGLLAAGETAEDTPLADDEAAPAQGGEPPVPGDPQGVLPGMEHGTVAPARGAPPPVRGTSAPPSAAAATTSPGGAPWMPATIAVGGVVDYARCPKRFYWSTVRPLPRFSGPAARIGTEIHRWIERRSSGQSSLIELDEQPDLTAEELAGEPGRMERLRQAFLESPFGGRVPLYAERPFLLHVDGFVVSGRIDAIYGTPEGPWEVVDYKTGRRPPPEDPIAGLQLDLYALACVEVWRKRVEDLRLTYLYLGSGESDSRPAGPVEETRRRVLAALESMSRGEFDPTPGDQCRWCDFLAFCAAGRAHVRREDEAASTPGAS